MWVAFALQKLLTFFSAKYIKILYIESAKIVNEMTLNELVKLTTLWTTGPRSLISYSFVNVFFLFFPQSTNMICRSTDTLKYFRKSLGLRDNENRLYISGDNRLLVTCTLLVDGVRIITHPYNNPPWTITNPNNYPPIQLPTRAITRPYNYPLGQLLTHLSPTGQVPTHTTTHTDNSHPYNYPHTITRPDNNPPIQLPTRTITHPYNYPPAQLPPIQLPTRTITHPYNYPPDNYPPGHLPTRTITHIFHLFFFFAW